LNPDDEWRLGIKSGVLDQPVEEVVTLRILSCRLDSASVHAREGLPCTPVGKRSDLVGVVWTRLPCNGTAKGGQKEKILGADPSHINNDNV
jgi:hypothetical protein